MINFTEKLVQLQNVQMKMMERAQSRTEEVHIKFEAEQRKLDERSQGERIRNSFEP